MIRPRTSARRSAFLLRTSPNCHVPEIVFDAATGEAIGAALVRVLVAAFGDPGHVFPATSLGGRWRGAATR